MNQPAFRDRVRYAFDNSMAKGPIALIGWLAVGSIVIIGVMAAVVSLLQIPVNEGEPVSFIEAFWLSLMRTFDAGTMGGDTGWGFRLAMLAVTLGGIFVISTLIGVLTSSVEDKVESLRKGRSQVLENGHTVILGWSEQVFTIVSELIIANENQRKPSIVILGDKDKVDMEDELKERIESFKNTRLVCRTGQPVEMSDLAIVSLHTAKSIIILSPENDDPDSHVIKTLLAITNAPNRRPEPYHIVAEIRNPDNLEVAKLVGRDEVELVLVGDLIARVTAQTCRQSGLSVVYTELLDYGGDEIYFTEEPTLVGKTFGDALLAYDDSAVIGLHAKGGVPQLNPPMDTRLNAGDRLVVISEDDDTIKVSGRTDYAINTAAIRSKPIVPAAPERTLILGWNWRASAIVRELDNYVAPGSTLTVVADEALGPNEADRVQADLKNQIVTYQAGSTTDRRLLESLNIAQYQHVILLCYADLEPQAADARTLITLLHLREISERSGHAFSIVSEMLDIRNRNLAEVTRADDFIVSDKLVSLMLAQISENKALGPVFADIFDPEGSEIYIKPAANYVTLGEAVNFYTVVEAARRRGEVAFGYRLMAEASDADKSYGVVVNPVKSETVTFTERDRVIVMADN